MGISISYVSPSGTTVTFNEGAPVIGAYSLLDYSGLDGNLISPLTQKSPYQAGNTLIGASVSSRTIALTVLVYGKSENLAHIMMKDLANALAITPAKPGKAQAMGKLKVSYSRNGVTQNFEIDCIPQESPQYSGDEGEGVVFADMEFYCPRPYWKSSTVKTSASTAAGTNLIVNNGGDIDIPCIIKVTGSCTDPIVTNVSTGDKFSFLYNLTSGQVMTVDSHFGNKSALVGSTNVLGHMKFAESTFITLRPGNNTLKLTTPHGNFGTLQVISVDEFSGIGA